MVENAIRPFVIGRKNWLFSDTDSGAEANAFYSLIETAVVGDTLWLCPKDVERVHRYRTKYGPGGFENRLMGIDFSSLKPANNEFPEE